MPNFFALFLIAASTLMTGCGEAMFFQDIRLTEQGAKTDLNQLISSTAYELGYISCSDKQAGYCNKNTGYSFELSRNLEAGFKLTFRSFGVPNRQGNVREDFAAALRKNCSECQIYVRDRSVWGFHKEDTEWKPF